MTFTATVEVGSGEWRVGSGTVGSGIVGSGEWGVGSGTVGSGEWGVGSGLMPVVGGPGSIITIGAGASAGTPTGTVTFEQGTTTLGTAILDSTGVAAFTTASLPAGDSDISVIYSGDGNYTGNTLAGLAQTVTQATSTITWSNPADISYGTPLSSVPAERHGFGGRHVYLQSGSRGRAQYRGRSGTERDLHA